MTISRRDFFLAGSTASALWLAGCGGGGSAGGAPKAVTSTASNTCSATSVTNATGNSTYEVAFSNDTAFAHADIPLMLVPAVGDRMMGCTNQIVSGVEGIDQELTICFIQTLTAAQTCNGDIVRALRLHLSIPHDSSGHTLSQDDVFTWAADSTNPTGSQKLFSGELIVTAPLQDDGQNCAVYRITGGTLKLVYFDGIASATLQLSNVTATAAAAGSGNNAAYSPGGRVQMDGQLLTSFQLLSLLPKAV